MNKTRHKRFKHIATFYLEVATALQRPLPQVLRTWLDTQLCSSSYGFGQAFWRPLRLNSCRQALSDREGELWWRGCASPVLAGWLAQPHVPSGGTSG